MSGLRINFLLFIVFIIPQVVSSQDTPEISTHLISDYHVISETNVKSDLVNVTRLMSDTVAMVDWLYFCKEARLRKTLSDTSWIFSFVYENPLRDRYILAKIVLIQDTLNSKIRYLIKKDPEFDDAFETPRRTVKVEDFDIFWEFNQVGDSVRVKYDLYLDPDISLFNFKRIIHKYLNELNRKTLENFTQFVQMEKYSF